MKVVFIISIFLMMLGCKTNKNLIAVEHLNPHEESEKFITKLKKEGVDTIIVYVQSCSGCTQGFPKSNFVYWRKESRDYITKFDGYSNYDVLSKLGIDFEFVSQVLDSMKNEELNKPEFELLHYQFERVNIILGETAVNYKVSGFEHTKENQLKYRVVFIDKFRSFLFGIKDYEWKALNYQYKDKKL